jgi:hypothetical protein
VNDLRRTLLTLVTGSRPSADASDQDDVSGSADASDQDDEKTLDPVGIDFDSQAYA